MRKLPRDKSRTPPRIHFMDPTPRLVKDNIPFSTSDLNGVLPISRIVVISILCVGVGIEGTTSMLALVSLSPLNPDINFTSTVKLH